MRNRVAAAVIGLAISQALAGAAGAEVLDRIMAVVEGHVITLSDVRQEREIQTDLGEKPAGDDSAIVKQLVDNYLIEQQISDYPDTAVTDAELNAALKQNPSDAVRDAVRRRIRTQKFINAKFREQLRPTDEQIRKYYDEVFLPEAQARGLKEIPPLSDPEMIEAVRNNVIQEMLDHEVNTWLEAIRQRSRIEFFH